MNPIKNFDDEPCRARIPAHVEPPDKVAYGLTFRQLAILAVAALAGFGVWRTEQA
ncbi:hypothetical protein E1091_11865 [Micromonospora fluostatini]|uniref:Uncharacterized protein n=1 Tax=Micromonospora fluostatini TaxID=1629071 RepID=A0ABY2DG15_9ACTN|nr:hypothetical protein E1091_11865 [Micromonospora fluostatini]